MTFTDDLEAHGTFVLRPDGKSLGPRLGGDVQSVFKAAKAGDWTALDDGRVDVAGHVLESGEYELALQAPEGVTAAALPGNDAVVALDTEVTAALEREGLARDLVRQIQDARKTEDLQVTDRIDLWLGDLSADAAGAAQEHEDYIASQVLAVSVTVGAIPDGVTAHPGPIASVGVRVAG